MKTVRQRAMAGWGKSQTALADTLRERLIQAKKDGKEVQVFPATSLRTRLRKWVDGREDFLKHSVLRSCLAELLNTSEDALFPIVRTTPERHPLRGFSLLGDIDPRDEGDRCAAPSVVKLGARPGRSGPSMTLFDARFGRVWIEAPPGAGRSLACLRWELEAAAHAGRPADVPRGLLTMSLGRTPPPRVLRVTTLAELPPMGTPSKSALVVKVEQPHPDDSAALKRLAAWGSVLVLAAFAAPRDETDGEWTRAVWQPDAAWRAAFVSWVAHRASERGQDSLLDAVAMTAWLDRVDPEVRRYATPGDLLPILALAHEVGERKLTRRLDANLVLRVLALRADEGPQSLRGWLRDEAPRLLVDMVRAVWRDPKRPWPATAAREVWEAQFPSDGLPHSNARIEAALTEVARARKQTVAKARDAALDEVVRRLESPDRPGQALAAMREAGMFGQALGGWAAGALWMQEVLAQDEVVKSLDHDPAVWGRWTVDLPRRSLVDHVLGELSPIAFESLLSRAVEDAALSASLGGVAALETLFLHAAERMESGNAPDQPEPRSRRKLFLRNRALWVCSVHQGLPASRTRGGPGESSRAGARWVAACWAWSLSTKPPQRPLPDAWDWIFPGWFTSLGDPNSVMERHEHQAGDASEASGQNAMRRMLPQFVTKWRGPQEGEVVPDAMLVAALPVALAQLWDYPMLVGALLQRSEAVTNAVAGSLEALSPDELGSHLKAMWDAVLDGVRLVEAGEFYPGEKNWHRRGEADLPRLTRLLRSHFPVERVVSALRTKAVPELTPMRRFLDATPELHRGALCEALLDDPRWWSAFGQMLSEADVHDVPLLESFTGRLHSPVAVDAARRLWQFAPDRAELLAERAWVEDGAIFPWMEGMTQDTAHRVVSIFLRHPEREVPPRFLRWFARNLERHGSDADAMYALLDRSGWADLAAEP